MTQGDPLSMVTCGIGILPLIKNLKAEFPDATQPWYTDNDGSLCTFADVYLYCNLLRQFGPGRGYYPRPSKIFLIVHPKNIKPGKIIGLSHGFKACNGDHYLGGFIRDDKSKYDCLKELT